MGVRTCTLLLLGLVFGAVPAAAQQGFALKGHYLYNSGAGFSRDSLPEANGFSLGAEVVLPLGIGLGISGYAAKGISLTGLMEANYFLKLPLLPLAPYAGVHAGLERDTERRQLGFQVGLRIQPVSLFGIDAQYRRVSSSAVEEQDRSLTRNQVLLGITLF